MGYFIRSFWPGEMESKRGLTSLSVARQLKKGDPRNRDRASKRPAKKKRSARTFLVRDPISGHGVALLLFRA